MLVDKEKISAGPSLQDSLVALEQEIRLELGALHLGAFVWISC